MAGEVEYRNGTGANGARRVTMTDVGRAAGCSQATVSVVLNNAPGVKISATTRERVIAAARELGYAAPLFAHLPVPASTTLNDKGTIGFIVDQIATSPEAVVAIEGARQACWEEGRVILIAQTMGDAEMEERTVETMLSHGVSALLYMTIFTRRVTLPACIRDARIPVVLLNCYTNGGELPSVVPAEVEGGYAATSHLLEQGHRRIAMITGEPWMEAARDRLRGYRRALLDAGLSFDPSLVLQGNWLASTGYECTRRLLTLKPRPTAIFCQNDRMAIGCYEALKEAGLRIPEDVSVVGYDDDEITRHLEPQLTTVVLPHRLMGNWAADQLSRPRPSNGTAAPQVRMECSLTTRASVMRVS